MTCRLHRLGNSRSCLSSASVILLYVRTLSDKSIIPQSQRQAVNLRVDLEADARAEGKLRLHVVSTKAIKKVCLYVVSES
jgi:hypothetical protein